MKNVHPGAELIFRKTNLFVESQHDITYFKIISWNNFFEWHPTKRLHTLHDGTAGPW
jgi:hypothetical protein